jgi:hypothetical protein
MPTISRRKPKPLTTRTRRPLATLPETRPVALPASIQQRKTFPKKSAKSKIKQETSSRCKTGNQSKKSKQKTKRFRRVKVLRWWVLPAIFFVPLCILLIEYYIGKLISIDDVKDVYYQQLGIDPFDLETPLLPERIGAPPSILNITRTSKLLQCSGGRKRMLNLHNPKSHITDGRSIPMIIHQHARTRCLTRNLYK